MADVQVGGIERAESNITDARWWLADKGQVWKRLNPVVSRIEAQRRDEEQADERHLRAYRNLPVAGLTPILFRTVTASPPASASRLTFNVTRSSCDAYVAEMVQSKPAVWFQTEDGNHDLQVKAKQNERWVEGKLEERDFYRKRQKALLHEAIFGRGYMKVIEDEDDIYVGLVLPNRLKTDAVESVLGEPRSIYEIQYIDRQVAIARWPSMEKFIDEIGPLDGETKAKTYDTTSDMIKVVEAFHLPSKKPGKDKDGEDDGEEEKTDGRHVICIANADLVDEPWTEDEFPYAAWTRQDAPIGDSPAGLVEETLPIQLELNKALANMAAGFHLLGQVHIVAEEGSVDSDATDNDTASFYWYKPGTPQPNLFVPKPVPDECWRYVDMLYGKAFELAGISQLAATAQKPAGLDSGEAQRVYNDTTSRRFGVAQRNDEFAVLKVANLMLKAARRLSDKGVKLEVKATDGGRFERLDFAEILMDEAEHKVTLYPVSALSRDPAQRIQQVVDWSQAGWIAPQAARRLMGMPDIEASQGYEFASYDLTMKIIDDIVTRGRYTAPLPIMDLVDAIKNFQLAALRAVKDEVPNDRVQMLMDWITQAQDILSPPQAAPPPGAAPAVAGPPTAPMPPPGPPVAAPPPGPPEGGPGGGMVGPPPGAPLQ